MWKGDGYHWERYPLGEWGRQKYTGEVEANCEVKGWPVEVEGEVVATEKDGLGVVWKGILVVVVVGVECVVAVFGCRRCSVRLRS